MWSEWCQGSQLGSAFPSIVLGFTFHLHSAPRQRTLPQVGEPLWVRPVKRPEVEA